MPNPHLGIVRLLLGRRAVGLGFLVGEREVLTCAHVVNTALQRDLRERSRPAQAVVELIVDFPFARSRPGDQAPRRFARLRVWDPDRGGDFELHDIAGLVLVEDPPPGAERLELAGPHCETGTVRLWGPSNQREWGGNVEGDLMGRVDGSRLQVDQRLRGVFRAERGFSGGPVWRVSDGAVVGMLQAAAAQEEEVDAYALSADALVDSWPSVLFRPPPNPYLGLRAFTEADEARFFGRENWVRTVAAELEHQGVAVVSGPSGSGKSSVVEAGLLPLLRRQTFGRLVVVRVHPGQLPRQNLVGGLAAAATHEDPVPLEQVRRWDDLLAGAGLIGCLQRLRQVQRAKRVVLVLDQLEELLTRRIDDHELDWFSQELVRAVEARDLDVLLVLGIRDDHYGRLLSKDRGLADALKHRVQPLHTLSPSELREAVEKPAQLADPRHPVAFEEGLVDELLADVQGRPGALPSLQFALTLLWDRQERGVLKLQAYKKIGGVSRALAQYADDWFERLSEDQQHSAKRVLTRLVTPGP